MDQPLTLNALRPVLERAAARAAARQVPDPSDPRRGAFLSETNGLDEPGHTGTGLLAAAALLLARTAPSAAAAAPWEDAARAALGYWERTTRPTGRIDLRDCNYDSDPDTGFFVQLLALAWLRTLRDPAPAGSERTLPDDLRAGLEHFLRRAARGLAQGGFHTPNHRWVVASALTLAVSLWPDLEAELRPAAEALLAEGPDLDEEGCFLERSVAIYDPVCVRALLLIDEFRPGGWPEGRKAALACLAFDDHLLHPDGAVETGLSRRQDHGSREVPINLLPTLRQAARRSGEERWAERAAWLWERAPEAPLSPLVHLALELAVDERPAAARPPPPVDLFFPRNRLWRWRQGAAAVAAFGGQTRLLGVRCGTAEMVALKIAQSYLGHGRFTAAEMTPRAGGLTLRSTGRLEPYRLGYLHPVGRPVPPEAWDQTLAERPGRPLPPCASELDLTVVENGLDLRYRTLDGLDRVPAVVACDFLPGCTWESGDCAFRPAEGQVIFLTSGRARLSYGPWFIEIEGGATAHRAWQMRDFEPPGGFVRVLLGFLTPVDHSFRLRWGRQVG